MKKSTKKLRLCRETLSHLTVEQSKVAAGTDTLLICPLPLTSDSVRVCCADI
jgi:hypothetical protein